MKKLLLATLLMLSLTAHAEININTSGLSEAQKAALVTQAEQMKNESKQMTSASAAASVNEWADVGEHFGKMIGGAAKEVGIAVNEFVRTPVGMMTAGLIIFNYAGGTIIHVTVGLLLFIVGISLVTWMLKRGTGFTIEYDKTKPNWLGNYPVLSKRRDEMSVDLIGTVVCGYLFTFIVSIWVMFSW